MNALPEELQAIRDHDSRDFLSTKCYVAGSAPVECRQDRRTLLALYDAQSDEVRRLKETLREFLQFERPNETLGHVVRARELVGSQP